MKKNIQTIIGEYDKSNNSIIIIFLTMKTFKNISILINNEIFKNIDINKFLFNKIILTNIHG